MLSCRWQHTQVVVQMTANPSGCCSAQGTRSCLVAVSPEEIRHHLQSSLHCRAIGSIHIHVVCVHAGCTRILVTHQRQYLPKCDRIAVLRNGSLIACGTWSELLPLQLPELVGGAVTMSLEDSSESEEDVTVSNNTENNNSNNQVTGGVPEQQQQGVADFEESVTAAATAVQGNGVHALGGSDAGVFGKAAAALIEDSAIVTAAVPGSNSSSSDDTTAHKQHSDVHRILSRQRTMPPDVNHRPADSSRGYDRSSSGWWFGPLRAGKSFVRSLSKSFSRRHGSATAAADKAAGLESGGSSAGLQQLGSGLVHALGSAKSGVSYSIQRLFVPPAYLPGGSHYVAPDSSPAAAAAGLQRHHSRVGLAMLGPVRSMLFRSVSTFREPPTAAALAAHSTAAGGDSKANGAAAVAAAKLGQLVAAESRATGSVSWGVYGSYGQQIGLGTCAVLSVALVGGQGVALAAEWWLAIWSSSPPEQQAADK